VFNTWNDDGNELAYIHGFYDRICKGGVYCLPPKIGVCGGIHDGKVYGIVAGELEIGEIDHWACFHDGGVVEIGDSYISLESLPYVLL